MIWFFVVSVGNRAVDLAVLNTRGRLMKALSG